MKKIIAILSIIVAACAFTSCAEVGQEVYHTDNSITRIEIRSTSVSTASPIEGQINQETGEILFDIPPKLRSSYDIKAVKVRATVGYDVKISPSLSGIKDLEEEYEITCTAQMTGESRKYTLRARYTRN